MDVDLVDKKSGIVVLFLLFVLVVAIGARVLGEFTDTFEGSTTITAVDETWASAQNASHNLDVTSSAYFQSVDTTTIVVWNHTSGESLTSGNYTTASAGTIELTATGNLTYGGSTLDVNYTWTSVDADTVYNVTVDATEGTGQIATFSLIVGILVAITIILGFLFTLGI